MATSSAPSTLSPSLHLSHLPSSTRPKLSSLPFPTRPHPNPHLPIISLRRPNSPFHRPFASPESAGPSETLEPPPEALEGTEVGALEGDGTSPLPAGADDGGKMPPKQKIRIKLRSYWVPLIEDSCKKIMDAARTSNAKTMGPVPLPTKRRIYCVVRSPHVNKDSRFHFEIRTHQRLIDILHPTAQTIDSLMMVDIPAGVDVEVKL